MKGFAVLALLVGGAAMLPAAAHAHAGSDEEQRACTPDVFRLCMNAIPDDEAIVACLKSKRTLLSPACAQVFNDPPPVTGRRRKAE